MREIETSRLRSVVAFGVPRCPGRAASLCFAPTGLADGLAPDRLRRSPRNTAAFAPTRGSPARRLTGDSAYAGPYHQRAGRAAARLADLPRPCDVPGVDEGEGVAQ